MSNSASFVGADNCKTVVHNFCGVARTNFIHHTLYPTQQTVERRLQTIWARTKEFTDLQAAKKFASSALKSIHPKVYVHYQEKLDLSDTLEKVTDFASSSFKQANRAASAIYGNGLPTLANEVKENLRSVWTRAQKTLGCLPSEIVIQSIKDDLAEIIAPQSIKDLYLKDLSAHGLHKQLQSYLNDLEVKGEGITSTSLGSQGYPKIIDVQRGNRLSGFMKTLSSPLEMDHHLLYSFFLNNCLEEAELQIEVPRASMFDIEREQYVDTNGKKHNISKYNESIKQLLGSIASLNTDASRSKDIKGEIKFQNIIQTSPAGFFELVSGLNLADFFREKYVSLDDSQKDHFWRSLGQITYLDLILGNRDRMIRLLPDLDDNSYSLLGTSDENPAVDSNLGNLMISHDFKEFYAIDNGIGDGQRSSMTPEDRATDETAYTNFLKNFLGREDFKALVSSYLLQSLKPAIEDAFQKDDYEEDALNAVISDISQDTHISSLECGMEQMKDLLTKIILPKWNHPEADTVKDTLDKNLVQVIQDRLNILLPPKSKPIFPPLDFESDEDDLVSELDQSISPSAWSSPVRSLGRETPFSPVMSRSRTTAIGHIGALLKNLASQVASQDIRTRVDVSLKTLEKDFLLPDDIQLKIAGINLILPNATSDKENLTVLINELADSLLQANQFVISPRVSRLPSGDEDFYVGGGRSIL